MSLRPWYNKDANYQTNAKSFMDYLARTNKFLEVLIEDYEIFQELMIEELKRNKFDSEMAVDDILNIWLDDGTLARVINDGVLGNKADKSQVQEVIQQLLTKADKTEIQDILQTLETKASQDDLNDVIQDVDSHGRSLSNLSEGKRNKENSVIYAVDVTKFPNETDDQFINRMLLSLPDEEGTVILDGTYHLEDTIVLTPYQTLQGTGQNTNLMMNGFNKDIIRLAEPVGSDYVYGVKILNLSLHGNVTNTGINLKKCSHLKIEDVYIYETGWGIWADKAWLAQYDRVTIRNYNSRGNVGFQINGGTSNLINNCWVNNFRGGYLVESYYSTFNSSACDNFTEYAYHTSQAATLNSCGAEKGYLGTDGYVFGASARSVVYNACETLNIEYTGSKDNGSIFYFNGAKATVNNYSHSGEVPIPEDASLMILREGSYTNFINPRMGSGHTGTKFNFDKYGTTSASVFNQDGYHFNVHNWKGSKDFVTE